jgi:DNA-binding NtrC family response regulator
VPRNVVLVQAANSTANLADTLAANAWQFLRATHPEQVGETRSAEPCHVGIVVFDETMPSSPEEFAHVVERSGIEWIAIIRPQSARDRVNARALSASYFDYHTLPVDQNRLLYSVGHAYGKSLLRRFASTNLDGAAGRYGMIGRSPKMQALFRELEKIIRGGRAPVFITGESGVGKELAARAVHRGSRPGAPFVPVNCGALPDNLIESLLFGHEKGAFTGAHERRIGCIEAANNGTIFLDEIGDLPRAAQASLLRFLQESTVVRVGSTRELQLDTRVIAATHMDLSEEVRAGRFREDLFYRLNVLNVEVPALRERGTDCLLLAEHFIWNADGAKAQSVQGFSREALKTMQRHPWPGNVRELLNRVQRAMIMCEGPLITPQDLQLSTPSGASRSGSLASARDGFEREIVSEALARNNFNIAATARDLRISRITLYRLLARLRIRTQSSAAAAPQGTPPNNNTKARGTGDDAQSN